MRLAPARSSYARRVRSVAGSGGRARGAIGGAGGRCASGARRTTQRAAQEAEGEREHCAECRDEQHSWQPPELTRVLRAPGAHFAGRPAAAARRVPEIREALR